MKEMGGADRPNIPVADLIKLTEQPSSAKLPVVAAKLPVLAAKAEA